MANRVALDVAMRGLEQHMTGMGVASGKVIDDGDMGFKLVNVLEKFNDMTPSAAANTLMRKKNAKELLRPDPIKQALIDKQTAEFNDLIKPTEFLRSDGDTHIADGVTLEGIFMLMLFLDGPIAMDFRAANSDVFRRHLAGDETLDLERLANSISTDPIKVALRERLITKKAAAAAAPVPAPAPIIEAVAEPATATAAPAPSAPAMEPPPQVGARVSYGLPAVGESLVGQRRQREDDDAQFNSELEYRRLEFRQKNVALAQKELDMQAKKIALDEIVRKNKLLDEKQKEIERLIEQNKARAPAPQLQRAPAPQPQRAPAPQPQRAPAPQPQRAPAPQLQRAPAPQLQRAPAPQFNSRAPAPQFNVITILQVAIYLYDESRIRNKMSREDVIKVGTPIAIEYRKYYHKAPEKIHWEGNQFPQNLYYEHHRLLLEQEIIKYDNMKGRS